MLFFSFWLTGQIVGHFKGFAGAIRCISCLSKQKIVASCGLDKFLRIHDIHSRRMVHKVYECLMVTDHSLQRDFHNAQLWLAHFEPVSSSAVFLTHFLYGPQHSLLLSCVSVLGIALREFRIDVNLECKRQFDGEVTKDNDFVLFCCCFFFIGQVYLKSVLNCVLFASKELEKVCCLKNNHKIVVQNFPLVHVELGIIINL